MLVYFVSLVDKIVGGVALSGNHNYYVVALTVRIGDYFATFITLSALATDEPPNF